MFEKLLWGYQSGLVACTAVGCLQVACKIVYDKARKDQSTCVSYLFNKSLSCSFFIFLFIINARTFTSFRSISTLTWSIHKTNYAYLVHIKPHKETIPSAQAQVTFINQNFNLPCKMNNSSFRGPSNAYLNVFQTKYILCKIVTGQNCVLRELYR